MTNLKKLVSLLLVDLPLRNITVKLINSHMVQATKNEPCEGYFSDDLRPVFAVATGRPFKEWAPVFLHEWCHVEQWTTQTEKWKALEIDQATADIRISEWLAGVNHKLSLITNCIRRVQEMELECEKMVVQLIKKHALEINCTEYTKGANAYLLFHNVMLKTRKWYNKPPDTIKEVTGLLPGKFLKSYTTTPKLIEKEIIKHCYD